MRPLRSASVHAVSLLGLLVTGGCSSHPSRGGSAVSLASAAPAEDARAPAVVLDASLPAPSASTATTSALDAGDEASLGPPPVAAEQVEAVRRRFQADPRAAATALDLLARTGDVATVIVEFDMDGGWRGKLHLVPELPAGRYEAHLEWVRAGLLDHDAFFASLLKEAASPVRYRWRSVELRFFRSVGQHRPSAYAEGWSVAYNVEGSLNLDANAVRELLFHEIFHLNDAAHGDWSVVNLKQMYAGLVARCGTRVDCLGPFAPTSTRVRNGTFYAFQPDNGEGVHEYAAELAIRYYREQRDAGGGAKIKHPFKCGPEQNGRSWKLMADEFFGGVDRVPACP